MYKVYYFFGGNSLLRKKVFATLHEATLFANKQPMESVLEIKYINENQVKKEFRT